MEKFKIVTAIFFGVLFFFPPSAVQAQEEKPLEFEQKSNRKPRPNLLAELNLTSEQIREIRRINQENRPSIRLAQQRLRDANRNLDKAIYADNIDEAALQILVRELQNAQIEVIKLRSTSELAVRRILTAQQLAKFRELRQKFMENTERRPNSHPRPLRNFPNRRFGNRQF